MHIPPTFAKRRKLSLTPLIDVIFLLLLFFMLSSTFSRFSEVRINSGSSGAGATDSEVSFLILNSEGLKLDGEEASTEDLMSSITKAKEAGKKALVLVVSENVSTQDFISLLNLVNNGVLPVSVARRSE